MKRKNVATALSALGFPGLGQYYLGQCGRALLFIVPAIVAGYVYFGYALDEASGTVEQILSGKAGLDPATIAAALEARPTPASVTLAGIVFIGCWIGSVADLLLRRDR